MTKLTHPLLSLRAAGSVGNTLSFDNRSGHPRVRLKPIPSDPKSLLQIYQRWLYQDYIAYWHTLTVVEKQTWETNARRLRITGFNYWMRTYLNTLPDIGGAWHLDRLGPGVLHDSSVNTNDLTIVGGTIAPGYIGDALFLDGVDDYADAGDDSSIAGPLIALTFMCWLYLFSTPQAGTYGSWLVDRDTFMSYFGTGTTRLYGRLKADSTQYPTIILVFPLLQWRHVAIVWDGSKIYTYYDGSPGYHYGINLTGTIAQSAVNFRLGRGAGMVPPPHCLIDEPRFYNRALSAADIWRHSQRGYPT